MAHMAVIGIDFGNESSYVAVPRGGGIETITNDYSLRATPSCVAFCSQNRIIGVAAKNQLVTNIKNTIFGFKRLLGKQWDDPSVQHELKYLPFQVCKDQNNNIGFKVKYLDEERIFTVQQVTAMFFTKLKELAEAALKCEVNQCVISVPSFFTNTERQALLDAAAIANLKVLRIFNETAATALSYGIYKQDLPPVESAPRNVIFVDCGHSSLQVSACAFNRGKLKVLSCAFDSQLGGRDIDMILADHLCEEFSSRYKIKPKENPRAFIRLLGEVEKLKKQMSANSTKLPLNIECFMDDKDVHSDMKRSDMEQLCAGLFERVERTLRTCFEESKLKKEDIYAVEIVGGSSRIPAIKSLIEAVFGKAPSTTLNQDEAVARGCTLQCAMLCPAILIRDFSITDIQSYPIKMVWDPAPKEDGHMEVFPKHHPVPFSKVLTFYRREPFVLNAVYSDSNKFIGQFSIKGVKPAADGENQKVKIKARININGIFSVVSATLIEKEKGEQEEPMDVSNSVDEQQSQQQQQQQQPQQQQQQTGGNAQDAGAEKQQEAVKKPTKPVVKSVELPVEVDLYGSYDEKELLTYGETEASMMAADRQERDRVDAKNALEEYIYELRGKLSSQDELAHFVPDDEKEKYFKLLDDLETWLYDDGENCKRQVYCDKLQVLKDFGEPIKKRKMEFQVQPTLLQDFSSMLQLTQKVIDQFKSGDEAYSHLAQNEVGKVQESTNHAWKWVEESRSKLESCSPYQNPPITAEQIQKEKNTFEQTVRQVLLKPKPTAQNQDVPMDTGNTTADNDLSKGNSDDKKENVQNNSEESLF